MSVRAESKRHAFPAVLVAVLLLLLWASLGPDGEQSAGPQQVQAQDTNEEEPARVTQRSQQPTVDIVRSGAETLHILLSSPYRTRYMHHVWHPDLSLVWPSPEDPDWDMERLAAFETTRQLLALREGRYFRDPGDLLTVAEEEGLLDATNLVDPETALLGLYTAWAAAEVDYARRMRAFQQQELEPHETWTTVSAGRRKALTEHEDFPTLDLGTLEAQAQAAIGRWPHLEVAEHAELALLRVAIEDAGGGLAGTIDSPAADSTISDYFASASPAFAEFGALLVVQNYRDRRRDGDAKVVRALRAVTTDSVEDDLRIASWAVNMAVAQGDWAEAATWTQRLREGIELGCSGADPVASHCEIRSYQLRNVHGRLAAFGVVKATNWREELVSAAWACHRNAGHTGTSRVHVEWRNRDWVFGDWDRTTPATECMSALGDAELAPPEGTTVRLTLERPAD